MVATLWIGSYQWTLGSLSRQKLRSAVGGARRGRFKVTNQSAFIARMPSGHVGLFVRGGPQPGRRKAAPRRVAGSQLPIDELKYDAFPIARKVGDYARDRWLPADWKREFERLLRVELERKR